MLTHLLKRTNNLLLVLRLQALCAQVQIREATALSVPSKLSIGFLLNLSYDSIPGTYSFPTHTQPVDHDVVLPPMDLSNRMLHCHTLPGFLIRELCDKFKGVVRVRWKMTPMCSKSAT